jgi:F0F1-type ATP synthase delta subunit
VLTARLVDEPQNQAEWLRRLAAYVVTHRMTDQVDLLVNDIAHELYLQTGLLTIEVVSARQLSAELKASISQLLQTKTGAQSVVVHQTVDADLLGGFVARTADAEMDASVRTKLRALSALSTEN